MYDLITTGARVCDECVIIFRFVCGCFLDAVETSHCRGAICGNFDYTRIDLRANFDGNCKKDERRI